MIKVVFNPGRHKEVSRVLVGRLARAAARHSKKIFGVIEVNLVDKQAIRALNRRYRHKDKVTDVLSFAWQEEKRVRSAVLGQIFICYPQIRRQAREYGVSVKEEFIRMFAHGLLHLAGYDHATPAKEKKMFALQEKIVSAGK